MTRKFLLGKLCTFLILFSLFESNTTLSAQSSPPTLQIVQTNGSNGITFEVHNLDEDDSVFYRFSDGFHLRGSVGLTNSSPNQPNPTAAVYREFRQYGTYQVIAYITKKNGPILRAEGSENFTVSTTGTVPTLSMGGADIEFDISWNPFTENSLVSYPIQDIAGVTTNNVPWFFLIATIKGAQPNMPFSTNITFQDDLLNLESVIIEESSGLPTAANSFDASGTNNYYDDVTYDGAGNISINFIPPFGHTRQVNVYFLMSGDVSSKESLEFFSSCHNPTGQLGVDSIQIRPTRHPHDPNTIMGYEPVLCRNALQEELTYRVDFQNLGDGVAKDVEVLVNIDNEALDPYSILNSEISSSHHWELIETTEGSFTFRFKDIRLPGTTQTYPKTYIMQDTKGWIEFKLKPQTPFTYEDNELVTTGKIIFYGEHDNFEQTTQMNKFFQKVSRCGPVRGTQKSLTKKEVPIKRRG